MIEQVFVVSYYYVTDMVGLVGLSLKLNVILSLQ